MIEGVTFILRNSANRFLLQLRDGNTLRHPHKWCFFGGSIELGESQAQALQREIFEELEYEMFNPRLLARVVLSDKEKGEAIYNVFADDYDETQKLVLGEGEAMQWFSLEEIERLDLAGNMRELLQQLAPLLINF